MSESKHEQSEKPIDIFDFINGQAACKEGVPCPSDASDSFVRGYSEQYQIYQIDLAKQFDAMGNIPA